MTRFNNINLGGEFAISYKIGALALPMLILTVPLTSMVKASNGTFLQWTIAAAIGTIIAILALLIVDKTIWANRILKPVRNPDLFIVGGSIGALKGTVTEISALIFFDMKGISASTIIERTISSASIGAISIPLIALLGFSLNARRQIHEKKLNELAGIDNLLEGLDNKLIEDKFLEDTSYRINLARQKFEKEFILNKNYNGTEVANRLIQISSELVRPLSHRAEEINKRSILKEHSWQETVTRFPSAVKLGVGWLMALYVASSARLQLQIRGIIGGLTILALATFFYWISLKIFIFLNRGIKINPFQVLGSLFVAMFLNSTLAFLASEMIFGNYKVNFVLNVFWCAGITVVVGFSTLYLTYELEELEQLNSEYSNKYQKMLKMEQGRPRISASLARYLHGTMQTRLIASAYRFKNLPVENDFATFEAELDLVLSHLTLPESYEKIQKYSNPIEMFDEIVELWSAFLEISIKYPKVNNLEVKVISSICELVNEALSNAFRHGQATKVSIEIESKNNCCLVTILDNGTIFEEPKPGLGMSVYDRVASKWNLYRDGEQTSLEATFTW